MTGPTPEPSRLLARDVLRVGSAGLRTRKLRAALSALGIAIGIASMVAVLSISASSQADLLRQIDALGTNLLSVTPGQSFFGGDAELPASSNAKLRALDGVEQGAAVYEVQGATARRSSLVDERETSGITVYAADRGLPGTLGVKAASGHVLTAAEERFPTVVLGREAARRLGIASADAHPLITIGRTSFTVVGILEEATLDAGIDRAALIGLPEARQRFGTEATPSTVYLRADDSRIAQVRALIPATANPENPEEVATSRPSDALEAKAAAKGAFTSLLLGLGAVALLVGGVGIANVMVISVLERRSEIGLRRALGATRRHISTQFLTESLLLATLGGVAGALLGAMATAVSSLAQDQPVVVPAYAVLAGVGAALSIGALAGLYPSIRASRLSPTEALRTV